MKSFPIFHLVQQQKNILIISVKVPRSVAYENLQNTFVKAEASVLVKQRISI
jgi:hypothetical protein